VVTTTNENPLIFTSVSNMTKTPSICQPLLLPPYCLNFAPPLQRAY
jgi:hypothetical protein